MDDGAPPPTVEDLLARAEEAEMEARPRRRPPPSFLVGALVAGSSGRRKPVWQAPQRERAEEAFLSKLGASS